MDNFSWLSLGKLRASYGTTGNDGLPNFTYVGAWSGDANYLDQPATVPTQIANPDLKWEETATLDIGLELSLFDNRLEANFGYFNRKTSDLLYGKPLPQTTGFTSVQENIGEMENNGFEIDLTGVAINSPSGFKLSIGANATFQKNKIVSLIDNEPVLQGFASAILVGQPLSTFYGLKFEGVDPGTGESIFADVNGDGVVDTNDNTVIGDAFPDIYGGFTLNASYKGLTLDAFFQFVDGVDVYNNTAIFNQNPGAPWGMSTAMRRRWMQEGDITDVPKASNSPGFNTTDNSRWLSDGSYMRLKNVTLSYDLPTNLISKAKLRSVRVFATGTNLLTLPGIRVQILK